MEVSFLKTRVLLLPHPLFVIVGKLLLHLVSLSPLSTGQLGGAGRDTQQAAASLYLCNPIKYLTLICRK